MKKTVLNNGLEVYTKTIDSVKTVTFSIYAKVGSYHETDRFGIAHFLEHMVFKGTKNRNSREIVEDIENVGGYINAETSFEHTRYFSTVPAEYWKVAADIISDIVFNSTIPEGELELERTVIQEELKMYSDDSSSHVTNMLFEAMHKSYPNRRLIGGTIESVAEITREDLINFKDKFYQPQNLFIVVTGNVSHDEVLDFIKEFKIDEIENDSELEKEENFEPDILSSETISLERNIEQAHFSWGLFGPSTSDKDSFAIDVACAILGGSSSSRLYQLIREKRGLAYTVSVGYMDLKQNGIIMGYVGLDVSKIEEVKEIVVEEFERLRNELVSDSELKRAIAYKKGELIISLERQSTINSFIGNSIINNGITDIDEFINKLESVTKEDIQRVSRKYFTPDNWQFSQIIPKNMGVN